MLDLLELGERGFDRTRDVGLEDDVEVLDALLHALEEDVERDGLRALRELLSTQALAAGLRVLARVPRWMSIVATGPRPTSSRDSTIGPDASAFGFALSSSSASATSSTFSSRSSRFCFSRAETSENCVVPPHSSG
jgi:hypothetical protein